MNKRMLVLMGILAVLIGVGLFYALPKYRRISQSPQSNETESHQSTPTPRQLPNPPVAPTRQGLLTDRRLPDGSFNPNPPYKQNPAEDPSNLLKQTAWRDRYRPLLEQTIPAGPRAKIAVFPFLDRTTRAVGMHCTYGWRPLGMAALGLWTNAQVVGFAPPARWGIPPFDPENPDYRLPDEQWWQTAMGDPAVQNAEYIITGRYGWNEEIRSATLKVVLLDRRSGGAGAPVVLFEEPWTDEQMRPDGRGFVSFGEQQRRVAREMADALIARGIVQSRLKAGVSGMNVEKELDDVALLLDSLDSWAMMEGVDRALALAVLFPDDPLPLQAAAYGLIALKWCMFEFGFQLANDEDYVYRAYALNQLALRSNLNSTMAQLNWMHASLANDHDPRGECYQLTGTDVTQAQPELLLYEKILFRVGVELEHPLIGVAPDWQVLSWDSHLVRMTNRQDHPFRQSFFQLIPHWRNRDVALRCVALRADARRYQHPGDNDTELSRSVAAFLPQWIAAFEAAALLTAVKDAARVDEVIGAVAPSSLLTAEEWGELAREGDFYSIRKNALIAFSEWPSLFDETRPAYPVIQKLGAMAERLYGDEQANRGFSGLAGVEFTPAERVRLAQRMDTAGAHVVAKYMKSRMSSYDGVESAWDDYFAFRPNNDGAHYESMLYAGEESTIPSAIQRFKSDLRHLETTYPIATYIFHQLACAGFRDGDFLKGEAYAKHYIRLDPFGAARYPKAALAYNVAHWNQRIEETLQEHIQAFPRDPKPKLLFAQALCQMGRWDDPRVPAIYAEMQTGGYYGDDVYAGVMAYWREFMKDANRARQWLDYYLGRFPSPSGDPLKDRIDFEIDLGGNDEALRLLAQMSFEGFEGYALASRCAWKARRLLALDKIEEAEGLVKRAASIDPWIADVIIAMAKLAFHKGEYETAMKEYQRYEDRYSPNASITTLRAKCCLNLGRIDDAIAILEEKVFTGSPSETWTGCTPTLMELYSSQGRKQDADEAMRRTLLSHWRTRDSVLETLEQYEQINPERAAEYRARIDEFMAGPVSELLEN